MLNFNETCFIIQWDMRNLTALTMVTLFLVGCTPSTETVESGEGEEGEIIVEEFSGSFLCTPSGSGPFPGALYNHGGLGEEIGGDLEGTCRALAEAGYVGYSKLRRQTVSLEGHLDDVLVGLDELVVQENVDSGRLAVLGFSRGGLLTLQAAILRTDLDTVVLMAPASGNGQLEEALAEVASITAPVLVLVSENDLVQADHVTLAHAVEEALEQAGKEVQLIEYPPFGEDGHELFFEIRGYWDDVIGFLGDKLR